MANLFHNPRYQPVNGSGDVYVGGLLYTYAAGTTTPLATYTTGTLGTAHANPVVADGDGRFAAIYMAASDYKFVLKDSAGATIWTEDNVSGTIDTTGDDYKASQQSTADMTVLVAAGSFWDAPTGAIVSNAAQTSSVITAPAANPRIDVIHINRRTGVIGVTTGAEAGSPSAPALAAGLLPIANVTLATTTTEITDSLITDVRELEQLGLGDVILYNFVDEDDMASDSAVLLPSQQSVKAYADAVGDAAGLRGYIDGLTLSNNSGDAAKDIDISAGVARDGGDAANMVLAASLTKKLDAAWAVGTDQGGLDGTESVGGTPDADTWYHVWLIRRSDTGVVDVLFSESATAPTMPTNYDQKRRIGAVLFDATPDIISFFQDGDDFFWDVPVQDYRQNNAGTSAVTRTLAVPTGLIVKANHIASFETADTIQGQSMVTSLEQTDTAPTASIFTHRNSNGGGGVSVRMEIRTNTSGQIRTRNSASAAATYSSGTTLGWIDPRGRDA